MEENFKQQLALKFEISQKRVKTAQAALEKAAFGVLLLAFSLLLFLSALASGAAKGQDTTPLKNSGVFQTSPLTVAPDYEHDIQLDWHSSGNDYSEFTVTYYNKTLLSCKESATQKLDKDRPYLIAAVRKCTFEKDTTADDVANFTIEMAQHKN